MSLDELRRQLTELSGIDFTSLTAVRRELERRGGETSTPGLRGEKRRQTLEVRLKQLLEKQGVSLCIQKTVDETVPGVRNASMSPAASSSSLRGGGGVQMIDPASVNWGSLMSIKSALDRMGVSTQTPGLKGDDRKSALAQRLKEKVSISKSMHDLTAGLGDDNGGGSATPDFEKAAPLAQRMQDKPSPLPAVPKLDLGLFSVPKAPYRGPGFGPKPPSKPNPNKRSGQRHAANGKGKHADKGGPKSHKRKIEELAAQIEIAKEKVEYVVERREQWVLAEMRDEEQGDFPEVRQRLRLLKSEQQRARNHGRRFIDSSLVSCCVLLLCDRLCFDSLLSLSQHACLRHHM